MEELNSENYTHAILAKEKPAVVMVKASWCSNCKAMMPVYEKVSEDLDDDANFFYLTVDDNEQLIRSLKIMGVPTTLFFRHGTLVNKKLGKLTAKSISKAIKPLISLSESEARNKEYRSLLSRLFGKK